MKGMTIVEAIEYHYPLAMVCAHLSKKEVFEQEAADDRYYDVIVTRCSTCNIPTDVRYATYEETERHYSEARQG